MLSMNAPTSRPKLFVNMETFAEYVKRHRTDADMKQDALAKKAGISQSYVSGIERGINLEVDPDYVRAIATALGRSPGEAMRVAYPAGVSDLHDLTCEPDIKTKELGEALNKVSPDDQSIAHRTALAVIESFQRSRVYGSENADGARTVRLENAKGEVTYATGKPVVDLTEEVKRGKRKVTDQQLIEAAEAAQGLRQEQGEPAVK